MTGDQHFKETVTQAVAGNNNDHSTTNIFNFMSFVPNTGTTDPESIKPDNIATPEQQAAFTLSAVDKKGFVRELIIFHKKHPQFKKILQAHAKNLSSTMYNDLSDFQLINLVGFKNLLEPTLEELIKHKEQAAKQTEINKKQKQEIEQHKAEIAQHKAQADTLKQRYESGLIKGILNVCTKPNT